MEEYQIKGVLRFKWIKKQKVLLYNEKPKENREVRKKKMTLTFTNWKWWGATGHMID